MLFKKHQITLNDKDAHRYLQFFVENTHGAAKSILAALPQTIQLIAEDEPMAWLDIISAWHQAIAREQLEMLSVMFYGGEQVEKQALAVLNNIEYERSQRGFAKQEHDAFMTRVLKTTNLLVSSESDSRYFDTLVALTTPLLAEDLQSLQYVEQFAGHLRMQHIGFWKKSGYCK